MTSSPPQTSVHRPVQGDRERLDDIRRLIQENQLDVATSRFLDFAQYYRPAQRNEATLLTRRWTEISAERRSVGYSQALEHRLDTLVRDLLEAVTVAEKAADSHAERIAPAPAPRPASSIVDGLVKRGVARLATVNRQRVNGGPAFQCEELSFHYGRDRDPTFRLSVDPLELRFGELTGLIGPNAAGKTTLMRMLAGEISPATGRLSYRGVHNGKSDWYGIRQAISYVPQMSSDWHGTMLDNLRFEAAVHGYRGAQNVEIVDYILSRLRLDPYANSGWDTLSPGYRTRFSLARALISDPVILILDEPLAFLDPGVGVAFLQDVVDLIRWPEKPIAALVSSQHIHEIEAIADQLLFIEAGRVHVRPSGGFRDSSNPTVFEISCSLTAAQLREVLGPLGSLKITENLLNYTITLPGSVDCATALARILGTPATILYFRDISRSTKLKFQI